MVEVTKTEAEYLRKNLKDISITKTMRQRNSRGKRYAPEMTSVFNILKKLRGVSRIETER